jgi:hypothetical protein
MGLFSKDTPRKFVVSVGYHGETREVWADNANQARAKAEEISGKSSHGVTDITDRKSDFELLNQQRW